ncbi:MAG TPA: gamma-glutamylcyclotransferase family protein [Candidatus Angelobacter sp.]|jgi:gamma-glutamylcyclotransferase (GGCT)/AIG2-like uncharacterized protein YtfP
MSGRLSEQWSNEGFRRSVIIALRLWNRALSSGPHSGPEQQQQHAIRALQELWTPTHAARKPEMPGESDSVKVSSGSDPAEIPSAMMDRLLDFPSRRLAVYGSLAPGKKNHHQMAGMEGTWRKALLRGTLHNAGWGAAQGFLGFIWDGSESAIDAMVFSSNDLPQHWQRLDEFEGAEYRRILVPVEILPQQAKIGLAGGPVIKTDEIEICNVYELTQSPEAP